MYVPYIFKDVFDFYSCEFVLTSGVNLLPYDVCDNTMLNGNLNPNA